MIRKLLISVALISLPIFDNVSYSQNPSSYIQVDGNKANALNLLKAGGIPANLVTEQKNVVPSVTITGDGPVPAGELVILTAQFDKTKLPDGLADIKFNWTVIDGNKQKTYFAGEGNKAIAFGAGIQPRTISVLLDVNCLFETKQKFFVVDKDGKNPVEKEFITQVDVVSPPPISAQVLVAGYDPNNAVVIVPVNPDKPPSPKPTPTFPEGQFGLAKFMYDAFTNDTNLDAKSKVVLASKLADGLEGISSQIFALSNYRDIPTILADTKKVNTTAFTASGIDLTKAEPLKTIISGKISELWKNQRINNALDISIAWQEISQGLRAIK